MAQQDVGYKLRTLVRRPDIATMKIVTKTKRIMVVLNRISIQTTTTKVGTERNSLTSAESPKLMMMMLQVPTNQMRILIITIRWQLPSWKKRQQWNPIHASRITKTCLRIWQSIRVGLPCTPLWTSWSPTTQREPSQSPKRTTTNAGSRCTIWKLTIKLSKRRLVVWRLPSLESRTLNKMQQARSIALVTSMTATLKCVILIKKSAPLNK